MGYILGLDLGPTSIGWAAIELDDKKEPVKIATLRDKAENGVGFVETPAIGSRIFPAGVDNLNQGQREEPKNKKRREKRSTRRRLRRAGARRKELVDLLVKKGFISGHQAVEKLQLKDPYEIRATAVSEKVELEDIARIFLHFAKRRGFKSNRRQPEDKDAKASEMKQAKERLAQELNGRTLGQFWNEKVAKPKQIPLTAIRNRRGRYQWVAERKQYQDELAAIWQKQAPFYPTILTKDFYDVLSVLLFKQIRFELSNRKKKKIIGTCELIPGKPRCPWANRKAQKFRLLQKVNDLLVNEQPLAREERGKLVEALSIEKEMKFDKIRKLLWGDGGQNKRFNLEYKTNDKIVGNAIDSMLCGGAFFDKKVWLKLDEQQKDAIWDILCEYLDEKIEKQDVERKISEKYGLTFKKGDWRGKLKEPTGYCSYSKEALDKILPGLEEGKNLDEAKKELNKKDHKQTELLPLPTKDNGISIPNPVVRSMLFQLRKVVNLLVKEKGLPDEVVIETIKEIKANKERRQEIIDEQDANQKERENTEKEIRERRGWGDDVEVSGTDILKYRLWKQQDEYCPYSCTKIPPTTLFTRDTEMDHILPYSMSLDNAMDNKVVCFSSANQDKGQNTPISWLGETSERWQKIFDAYNHGAFGFSEGKWERFCTRNEDIADKYMSRRLLQDAAYIAREVREYLYRLYPADKAKQKVRTTKGGITAELRNLWSLNAILRDGEIGPKNREDLRHHAIDAAVVALTNQGQIQRITKKLQQNWPKRPKYAEITEPWDGFGVELAKAIGQVKVSHRVQRKVKGALHQETNYALEKNGKNKDKYITRKALSGITPSFAEQICDDKIREMVLERLAQHDNDPKKAFTDTEPLYLPNEKDPEQPIPIRSVRVWVSSNNMISLKNDIWVEPGSNHHVEVFRAKKVKNVKDRKKYENKLIRKIHTVWEVSQRIENAERQKKTVKNVIITKENPFPEIFEEVEFVMSLSIGEAVLMKNRKGQEVLARAIKMSYGSDRPTAIDILFAELSLTRIEETVNKKTEKAYRITSMAEFEDMVIKKVTIDPLGRIRRAND
jgi:CRISPR-associated endonuclease Csn1